MLASQLPVLMLGTSVSAATLTRHSLVAQLCMQAPPVSLSVYRLAVSATPKSPAHVAAIANTGITHVYTLTEEEPLPASFFRLGGPQHTFSPVPDGRAPTFAQVAPMLV